MKVLFVDESTRIIDNFYYSRENCPAESEHNDRHSRLRQILHDKICRIQDGTELAATGLGRELGGHFGDDKVFTILADQFPSFSYEILINEERTGEMTHRTSICIDVSLLCNYFTCLVEDKIIYDAPEPHLSTLKRKPIIALSRQVVHTDALVNKLADIGALVTKHFIRHEEVHHWGPFMQEFAITPHGFVPSLHPSNTYSLLFTTRYAMPKTLIVLNK